MIPYVEISPLGVGFIKLDPFIVCVGIGIVVAFYSVLDRAKEVGLDTRIMYRMTIWIIFGSFFAAHVFSMVFDFPDRLLEKPWELFFIWAPISSMGGFLGAILVIFIFVRIHRISLLAYSDALMWGVIPGWIVGRLGCALVHDHPGTPSSFILAVQYPGGARHDLGFYEFLFTLLILWPLSRYIGNKVKIQGLVTSLIALLYIPVRFGFDFLRAWDDIPGMDPRYGGLTATQWVCLPLFVSTIVFLTRVLSHRR
jgi:phosphatidylglycerol:prolipoprotein diacylglycerol transferase